jgi:8-oxo-(d)GTP phosphatase
MDQVSSRSDHGDQEPVRAAGAILWRAGADGPELAVIHRPRYDDWSFPKGKVEPGEHIRLTAVREVFEETGQHVVLGRRLPSIEYPVAGRPKHVRYWAAQATSEGRFSPGDEVDRLEWLSADETRGRLSRPLDVTVLDAFLAAPARTVPVFLLRHGSAEKRSAQQYPNDLLRPLAAAGRAQAAALADLVAAHGPLTVISSSATRCVETVRPLAARQQLAIEKEPALTEPAHEADPSATESWLRALLAEGRPAVVCSHLPVLQDLLPSVIPDPQEADGPWINGRPWSRRNAERLLDAHWRPGCAWVLHLSPRSGPRRAPRLVAVDRLRPTA